jgi:hypothetical protein
VSLWFCELIIMQEEWVICRIFHKTGEKKNVVVQGQSYGNREAVSSPGSGSLTPLECQFQSPMQGVQNPFVMSNQENDINSIYMTVVPVKSFSLS